MWMRTPFAIAVACGFVAYTVRGVQRILREQGVHIQQHQAAQEMPLVEAVHGLMQSVGGGADVDDR